MSIIFIFLPWIIQGILSPISLPLAFGVSLFLALISLWRSQYILEWITFIFFLASFIISFFVQDSFLHNAVSLLSTITLCLFSWITLWLKKPFTLHYAKKKIPEPFWTSFLFLKINKLMTSFFGILFSLELILKLLRLFYPKLLPYSLFSAFFSISILLLVSWFPKWYKERAKKKGLTFSDKQNQEIL
ncbi:MAG: hypothetical protein WCP39_00660 [Chlamydiota bacterium]